MKCKTEKKSTQRLVFEIILVSLSVFASIVPQSAIVSWNHPPRFPWISPPSTGTHTARVAAPVAAPAARPVNAAAVVSGAKRGALDLPRPTFVASFHGKGCGGTYWGETSQLKIQGVSCQRHFPPFTNNTHGKWNLRRRPFLLGTQVISEVIASKVV